MLEITEKSQQVTKKFKYEWRKLLAKHLENPLNQYRLIRRFYRDWNYIKRGYIFQMVEIFVTEIENMA